MARGLFSNWKQPLYYNYDAKLTKCIINTVISKLYEIKFEVVAVASDLGGGNRALWNEMGITESQPFFKHPCHKNINVYVFSDTPHLIKLLRNHFLDSGFHLDNKLLTKQPLVELLEKQSGKDSTLNQPFDRFSWGYLNTLNTASLELQGCIASHQGNFAEAVKLLEKAEKNEIELGYGEPPLYARPVAYSIANMYKKAGKPERAIEKYNDLLKRFPKSAMVYFELLKVHTKKGDLEKMKEFESKLKEAIIYADKGMFEVKKK